MKLIRKTAGSSVTPGSHRVAAAGGLTALLVAATAVGAPAASAAPPDRLGTVEAIAVDAAHHHVFVAGSDATGVYSTAGTLVATVPGAAHAVLVRPDAVYLGTDHGITPLDPTDLSVQGTPLAHVPPVRSLAWAGGRIWASIDDSASGRQVLAAVTSDGGLGAPQDSSVSVALLSVPNRRPADLWEVGFYRSQTTVHDGVQGTTLTRDATHEYETGGPFALSADGSTLLEANNDGWLAPQTTVHELDAGTLQPDGVTYLPGHRVTQLASYSVGGQNRFLALDDSGPQSRALVAFAYGSATALATYPVVRGGWLAVDPAGRAAYLTTTTSAGATSLQVVPLTPAS